MSLQCGIVESHQKVARFDVAAFWNDLQNRRPGRVAGLDLTTDINVARTLNFAPLHNFIHKRTADHLGAQRQKDR